MGVAGNAPRAVAQASRCVWWHGRPAACGGAGAAPCVVCGLRVVCSVAGVAPRVVARVSADEQNVDGALPVGRVLVEHGIVGWKEECGRPTPVSVAPENRGKVAHHAGIGAEVRAGRRCGPPGDRALHAGRQPPHERTRKAHWVEVVEHVGAVVLDLREQNGLGRAVRRHALLRRPHPLQNRVVGVGEECRVVTAQHRLEKMTRPEPVIEERIQPLAEGLLAGRQLVEPRQVRRIDCGVLKQAHL